MKTHYPYVVFIFLLIIYGIVALNCHYSCKGPATGANTGMCVDSTPSNPN